MSSSPNRWPFLYSLDVRWGDMDALGHVNNSIFFRYLESARIAWYDSIGVSAWRAKPTDGPGLVATELAFRRQLKYPAKIVVEVRTSRMSARSFSLDFRVVDAVDDTLYAEGSSTNVWVDYAAGKALPLPEPLRAVLREGGAVESA